MSSDALSGARDAPNAAEAESRPTAAHNAARPISIRRTDVVAFSLAALLTISVVAVLYVGKAFFLPVVTAFIVGTMLSPAAGYLEKHRIPRAISAVLIVTAACAVIAILVGLISASLIQWSHRLPELGATLKEKLHLFDRPLALWRQFEAMFGGGGSLSSPPIQLPRIEWQSVIEFLSPTFTEILLFFATLVLFLASWRDLRRALIMVFRNHESRLRALRILNEIEVSLGGYLMTVTWINLGVGVITGLICTATAMPNPAGLGALAATLNFFPIIGPIAMFIILTAVGLLSFTTVVGGIAAPAAFAVLTFLEGHFVTPSIIGHRLALNALAVFIALAFWTWLWGPMGGFLSSPLLIVGLVLKDHLLPPEVPQLPVE